VETDDRANDPVAQGSGASDARSARGHARHHHRRNHRRLRDGFLGNYWRELVALVLLAAGIFLLTEKFQIRATLYRLLAQAWAACQGAARTVAEYLSHVEKSDIVGMVLVVLAIGLVGFDIRARMLRRYPGLDEDPRCPVCGKGLRRVRSKRRQRLLGSIFRVRVRRYACRACDHRFSVWRTSEDIDW